MSKYNKGVIAKTAQFLSSWEEYAADKSFAGLSLAELETNSAPPFAIRKDLADARTKVRGLILKREKADKTLNELLQRVANAIRADEEFGEDCPFYRSLGFVPKSERKTGRTTGRKKTGPFPTPPDTEPDTGTQNVA